MKIIVEQNSDGFVAYPVGFNGVVVAQGDSYDEAVKNVESAIQFHLETFSDVDREEIPFSPA
jgi:predicted RNase H-like HicB family nuclease